MRLTKDMILFTYREMPKWNPMNVCSYHLQEAGATPVQELAYALATAIAVLDTVRASGEVAAGRRSREVVGRISFFVNAGMRFVTELCKMRAFAELWDEITRDRYGVSDEQHRRFRYGVQVNSLGLTEQQPENNVYRILHRDAGRRAVQGRAGPRGAAPGLERGAGPAASVGPAMVACACSRSMAYETDLLEYGDIFDGSRRDRPQGRGAEGRGAGANWREIDAHGRRDRGGRDRLHEAAAGRIERAAARRRSRRASRSWSASTVRRDGALAADRRRRRGFLTVPIRRSRGRAA